MVRIVQLSIQSSSIYCPTELPLLVLSSQPAYHSKQITLETQEACSCALCPLRTELKGPAPISPPGEI